LSLTVQQVQYLGKVEAEWPKTFEESRKQLDIVLNNLNDSVPWSR
jgi:hypothetical protein